MKVVKYYRNALSRQVGDAIRIQRRGLTLNSKGEYNRCKITRLMLGNEELDLDTDKGETVVEDNADRLLEHRDRRDKVDRLKIGRPNKTEGRKRKEADGEPGRRKRRKYDLVEDSWGQGKDGDNSREAFLMSGLEGTRMDTAKADTRKQVKADQGLIKTAKNNKKITDWAEVTDKKETKEPNKNVAKTEINKKEKAGKQKVWTRLDFYIVIFIFLTYPVLFLQLIPSNFPSCLGCFFIVRLELASIIWFTPFQW